MLSRQPGHKLGTHIVSSQNVSRDVNGTLGLIDDANQLPERLLTPGQELDPIADPGRGSAVGEKQSLCAAVGLAQRRRVRTIVHLSLLAGHPLHFSPAEHQVERHADVREKQDQKQPRHRAGRRPSLPDQISEENQSQQEPEVSGQLG